MKPRKAVFLKRIDKVGEVDYEEGGPCMVHGFTLTEKPVAVIEYPDGTMDSVPVRHIKLKPATPIPEEEKPTMPDSINVGGTDLYGGGDHAAFIETVRLLKQVSKSATAVVSTYVQRWANRHCKSFILAPQIKFAKPENLASIRVAHAFVEEVWERSVEPYQIVDSGDEK